MNEQTGSHGAKPSHWMSLTNKFRLCGNHTAYFWNSNISNPYCNFWMDSYSGSYATDARIRLETLKSGSSSPAPTMNELMYSYDFSKDIWKIGQNEISVLDSVDLIDVEKEEKDEERWLYVSPKEFAYVQKPESGLKWCRHVLDNLNPDLEAAGLKLRKKLNLSHDHNMPLDHIYKIHSITDVYDVVRIQEASLRQESVYTPRISESLLTLPSCFHTFATNAYNKCHKPKKGSAASEEPTQITPKKSCLSPTVTRLHQYKALKRSQNNGSSSMPSSPIRTSLRSLQAVRNSQSLDIDDYDLEHIFSKPAIKTCQRSHSLSPCRIPRASLLYPESSLP